MPNSDVFATGAEEAFESAVNSYTNRDNRQVLWLEYLAYKERLIRQSPSRREYIKSFFDLAKRCLACMPASRALPLQYTKFWDDYEFHNTVCFQLQSVDAGLVQCYFAFTSLGFLFNLSLSFIPR